MIVIMVECVSHLRRCDLVPLLAWSTPTTTGASGGTSVQLELSTGQSWTHRWTEFDTAWETVHLLIHHIDRQVVEYSAADEQIPTPGSRRQDPRDGNARPDYRCYGPRRCPSTRDWLGSSARTERDPRIFEVPIAESGLDRPGDPPALDQRDDRDRAVEGALGGDRQGSRWVRSDDRTHGGHRIRSIEMRHLDRTQPSAPS